MNKKLKNNNSINLDIDECNIDLLNITKKQKINNIKLYNRYGAKLWLEHINEDLWQLKADNPEDLEYMRVIYEDDNKSIHAIDPSGGPYLSLRTIVGFEEKYIIDEILPNGYIMKLSRYKI